MSSFTFTGGRKRQRDLRYDPAAASAGVVDAEGALATAPTVTDPAVAADLICSTLRENQVDCVKRAVAIVGVRACMELLVATVDVEALGGLPTAAAVAAAAAAAAAEGSGAGAGGGGAGGSGEGDAGDSGAAPPIVRRRSPGGVFFHLLKEVASKAQYKAIFAERDREHQRKVNAAKKADGRNRCTSARMAEDA